MKYGGAGTDDGTRSDMTALDDAGTNSDCDHFTCAHVTSERNARADMRARRNRGVVVDDGASVDDAGQSQRAPSIDNGAGENHCARADCARGTEYGGWMNDGRQFGPVRLEFPGHGQASGVVAEGDDQLLLRRPTIRNTLPQGFNVPCNLESGALQQLRPTVVVEGDVRPGAGTSSCIGHDRAVASSANDHEHFQEEIPVNLSAVAFFADVMPCGCKFIAKVI